jgi:hypothetical protein
MSGIKTFSTALSFYVEERTFPNVFFFQRLMMEFVSTRQRGDDFCLTLGIGGFY